MGIFKDLYEESYRDEVDKNDKLKVELRNKRWECEALEEKNIELRNKLHALHLKEICELGT